MFSQECFEASLEKAAPKILENIRQNDVLEFPLDKIAHYSLQPTTRPKTLLQITFLEVLRNLYRTVLFSLTLQTCGAEFLSSTKMLTLGK